MNKKNLLLTLSILGILISAYLAYAKLTSNPLICGFNEGCNVVQKSEYAVLLGIPLGIWGMGYFFSLFTVFYSNTFKRFRAFLILWGLLFSFYLTYLEAFVINAYCIWCLASLAVIVLIALLHFVPKKNDNL